MPWFNIWDGLKSKICRYFLRRYLGQFLDDELNLEQLKLELCGGKATLCDVALKVEALNELVEMQGWPFEFSSAHIGELIVTVPWNALLTNDSSIEIVQITLRVRPVHRAFYGLSMLESMWSSASSSLQLAQECMKQADEVDGGDNFAGNFICLDKFTETIDNVLNRITVQISNLVILIEYPLKNDRVHMILEIKLDSLLYKNKSGIGKVAIVSDSEKGKESESESFSLNASPAFLTHNVLLKGINISLEENRNDQNFYSSLNGDFKQLILQMKDEHNMEIIVKQCEEITGPKVNLNIQMSAIKFFLAPRQINLILNCFKKYTNDFDSTHVTNCSYKERTQFFNKCDEISKQMEKSNYMELYGDAESGQFVSNFNIKITALIGVLLHEDVLCDSKKISSTSISKPYWNCENIEHFSKLSQTFYETMGSIINFGFCNQNYLFLNLTPISIVGNQLRNDNEMRMELSTVISKVDLFEVIEGQNISIFKFFENDAKSFPCKTDLQLRYFSINNEYQKHSTGSELTIILGNNTMEIDISIIDRIAILIQQIQLLLNNCGSNSQENSEMKVFLECKKMQAILRFPIINNGVNSVPSWRLRQIRDDYFLFKFQSLKLNGFKSKISLHVFDFTMFYVDGDLNESFKILTVQSQKNISTKYHQVWIILEMLGNLKDVSRGDVPNEIKPFSSRKSCQQRNTAGFIKTDSVDTESTVFPGEKHEIDKFCSTAMSTSKLQLTLNFPTMDLFFGSKKLYEIIYNRLNADILMWSSRSPYLQTEHHDSLETDKLSAQRNNRKTNLNKCSISLSANKTKITLCTSKSMDTVNSNSKKLFENFGKFIINADNSSLFIVSGYGGDENLSYACVQVSNFEIYHCENEMNCDVMHNVLYQVPPNLTKGPIANNENREMISVAIEIRKENKHKIKRIKISNGIKRMAVHYDQAPLTHAWLIDLLDFLDVMEYPVEGVEFYGTVIEMQMHFWDCAVDFRPKDFDYRAVMEVIYFCITSNIISDISGANLRFILEECVISIAPNIQENYNSSSKSNSTDLNDLVPVIDIGLFDISLRLNKNSLTNTPKLDFRCILNNVHMRTCYDSASALAQLINYIGNDTQRQFDLNNTLSKKSPMLSDSNETLCQNDEISSTLIEGITNVNPTSSNVNLLLAEAVQETSINFDITTSMKTSKGEQLIEQNAINIPDYEAFDVIAFESSLSDTRNVKCTGDEMEMFQERHTPLESSMLTYHMFDSSESASQELHFKSDDDYCIIDEKNINFEDIKLINEPIRIVDNHFCVPTQSADPLRSPDSFPVSEQRYVLCEMTFSWHMYGGYDFAKTTTSKCNIKPCTQMSATYRRGFAYIENSRDAKFLKKKEKSTWKSDGGKNRNHEVLVELQLSKLRFSYDIFPQKSMYASRKVLLIREIEMKDRLQCSDINKLLYSPTIKNMSNKIAHHMLILKAVNVKPNPNNLNSQECSLRISLAPIRLHVDQATLEFLLNYFFDLKKEYESHEFELMSQKMNVEIVPEHSTVNATSRKSDFETSAVIENDSKSDLSDANKSANTTYFRELIFSPAVTICFDYHGRRVVLSKGPIAGLLMGLGQLQCSQIVLKKISHKRGILGIEKLIQFLCKEWLQDIKRHQLSKILSGIGPTYAFVQLFQGIHDLFWLPVEYYHRDGTVIRGLRMAAQSFSTRTVFAIIELTSRLIEILQFTAETTFDIVSADTSMARRRKANNNGKFRLRRPKDIREGVVNAYELVKEGFNDSANNLIDMAKIQHDQHGVTGAVGAVLRQVPQLVVSPAVLATQATTNILGGVKNSLLPKSKIEEIEKWKEENF